MVTSKPTTHICLTKANLLEAGYNEDFASTWDGVYVKSDGSSIHGIEKV